jgi:type I restriction enzyme S subunit
MADIITGSTPSAAEPDSWGDDVDFITPSDQSGDVREAVPARRLSAVGASRLANRIVPAHATNLTCIGSTIGKVSRATSETVTNQQINSLIARDGKADPDFLYYMIRNWSGGLKVHASGSATPIINKSVLSMYEFRVPSLDSQRDIGAVLCSLDDMIAANRKLAAIADDLALSLVSDLKPSIPLGDITIHKRKSVSPDLLEVPKVAHYSLPAYDKGRTPEYSSPTDIKSSKFLVERPSVLVSKLNPRFPRIWNIIDVPRVPALASTEFLVLESRFTTTSVLWALLRQETFGFELELKVAGTSGSHQRVKPADLLSTHVADPRRMGLELTDKVTSLGESSLNARLENETLAATRDALLPQLMSGKLRVKDVEKVLENAGV